MIIILIEHLKVENIKKINERFSQRVNRVNDVNDNSDPRIDTQTSENSINYAIKSWR